MNSERVRLVSVSVGLVAALVSASPIAAQPAASPAPWELTPVEREALRDQSAREQREHPTLSIGAAAPDFSLRGTDGAIHRLADYAKSSLLAVVFLSNSCPLSQMYEARIQQIASTYASQGVQVVAIAPNAPNAVPLRELAHTDVDDSFDGMVTRAEHRKFTFPYLYDGETQSVAHAYGPKATPHLFIFDRDRTLRYEGRIDDAVRGVNVGSRDATNALDALLNGRPVPVEQTPVNGCATKWRSQTDAKARELTQWRSQPVTLQVISADGLKKLRTNPTGKTLMINFWATWCGPCAVEFPELLTSYLWYRGRELEFITVALNTPEERAGVLRFLEEHHAAVTNYFVESDDIYGMQAAFDSKWESGVPFTIVLAPDGTELYRIEGEADIPKLRRRILGMLPDVGAFEGNTEYWKQ